ncbi:MAG: hypothetical protein KatS3mg115_0415 [Candidatus Poribacteria bacterium]|nr:MAG: hypothetical protein KatS3mg115_0415 [Candidatus Poribacteria bacterium]
MEALQSFYAEWKYALGNATTLGLLALAAWAIRRAAQKPYWREAAERVFRTRRARISFAVLSVYVLIAVLDSLAWRDPVRDETGQVLRDASGQAILQPTARSLLDRLDAATLGLSLKTERTFSAPLATHTYTKETITTEDGRIERVHQPLNYPPRPSVGHRQGRRRRALEVVKRHPDGADHWRLYDVAGDSLCAVLWDDRGVFWPMGGRPGYLSLLDAGLYSGTCC